MGGAPVCGGSAVFASAEFPGGCGASSGGDPGDVSDDGTCYGRAASSDGHSGEAVGNSGDADVACSAAGGAYAQRADGIVRDWGRRNGRSRRAGVVLAS